MTPDQLAGLVDRYGLPLVLLGAFLWLFLRGKLVTGAQLAAMTALFERERADRIAAETIIAKFAAANADVAEAIAELSSAVLKRPSPRAAPRREPYSERLAGTPKRDG